MKDFFSIFLISTVLVIFLAIIRGVRGELALPLSICISVGVMGFSLAIIAPLLEFVSYTAEQHSIQHLPLLLKSLGVSLVTCICADICKDAGENAIASSVIVAGKCEIIVLALPLMNDLLELLTQVLEG